MSEMSEERRFYVPPGGPPAPDPRNSEIYAIMGEENIFKMLADFYQELGASSISYMFPEDLVLASERSAAFFVSVLGGPPLYQQKYGPPMMRKRHMPFVIDENARQVWLACFKKTLIGADEKYKFPMDHMDSFWYFLDSFSGWMVNANSDKS